MRKRSGSVVGLLALAGIVALVVVSICERPSPSRSTARTASELREADGPDKNAVDVEPGLPEGTLWGIVTVPSGVDVTEVQISVVTEVGIYRASNTGISPFRASIGVSRDGTFRREGLPLGEYQLLAKHPRCATYRTQFELRAGRGTGPVDVVLGGRGSLLVRIVRPNGRGLGGEHIAVHRAGYSSHLEYRLEPAGPATATGRTGTEGQIRFADLDTGTYTLTRRGAVIEQRTATVRADQETVVLFDARAALFGRLLGHDGEPIPEAKLFLRASGGRIYETRTDDAGAIAIRGIAAGDYAVTATVKGLGTIPLAQTLTVEAARAHEHELRLPAIRITGSVVHAESGAPFTSRSVSVHASGIRLSSHESATTVDGRFELANLYPGKYSIVAYPVPPDDSVKEAASEVVTIAPTPATQELVLRIPRIAKTARLRLSVRDRNGKPAGDLVFAIDGHTRVHHANGVSRSRDATVVEPGVYDVLLVPGTHRIHVRTKPSTSESGRRSWYYEEIEVEVESGQVVVESITLQKRLGH